MIKKGQKVGKDFFGDFASMMVPMEHRRSTLNMFMVYMGVLACIAAIWGGGALAATLGFSDLLIAAFAGCAILAILGGLTGYIGGITRATTYMIFRYPFGRIGSMVMGIIASGIGAMLWFAVQTWLFGIIINTLIPGPIWTSIGVAALWGGILMMTTALYGYRAIVVLSFITVPLFFVLAITGLSVGIVEHGGLTALMAAEPAVAGTLAAGITMTVGFYAVGAVITSDIARYAEKPIGGPIAWGTQVFFFFPVLLGAGGAMTLLVGAPHLAEAMMALGLGAGALLLAILGQWTTNDSNLWAASLSFCNAVKLKRVIWVAILGIIGTAIAVAVGIGYLASMDPFITFAMWLGILIPPMGGVMIADFYVFRRYVLGLKEAVKRYTFGPRTKYSIVNWCGVVGVALGGLIAWLTLQGAIPGIPAINGILGAFLAYLALAGACVKAKVPYELGTWVETKIGY